MPEVEFEFLVGFILRTLLVINCTVLACKNVAANLLEIDREVIRVAAEIHSRLTAGQRIASRFDLKLRHVSSYCREPPLSYQAQVVDAFNFSLPYLWLLIAPNNSSTEDKPNVYTRNKNCPSSSRAPLYWASTVFFLPEPYSLTVAFATAAWHE